LPKKHICPNGCGDEFYTTAHVMQEWKVDGYGNFISVEDDCLQITYAPNNDNIWACVICGADAIMVVDSTETGGESHA